jgi:hypothetical protein
MGSVAHDPLEVENSWLVHINTVNKDLLLVLVKQLLGAGVEVQSFKS